jgi:hypothetical protein
VGTTMKRVAVSVVVLLIEGFRDLHAALGEAVPSNAMEWNHASPISR